MIQSIAEIWADIDSRVRFGIKPGLERMRELVHRLRIDRETPRVIHVAGTNGKGSLCYIMEQLLRAGGASTGQYVSPHILSPTERIRVNGQPLSESSMLAAWRELEPLLPELEPSYFELLTALAFVAFRNAGVKWWILECGLGGRYDATNVLDDHDLAVITSVDLDHTQILGDTLTTIASDKAGIARSGRPLLLFDNAAETRNAVAAVCEGCGARFLSCTRDCDTVKEELLAKGRSFELHGCRLVMHAHGEGWRQSTRAAMQSLALLGELPQTELVLDTGAWPGRMDLRRETPPLLLDVAHNPAAIQLLCHELEKLAPGQVWTIVFCAMADKDLRGMLQGLKPHCRVLHPLAVTHRRALDAEAIATLALEERLPVGVALTPEELPTEDALDGSAFTGPTVVTGSFLTVSAWLGRSSIGLPPGL